MTLLFDSYTEDEIDGETRTVLKFAPSIAPIKAAILPLTKKQLEQSEKIFKDLKTIETNVMFDVSGSIGKRYRRQDELGTPFCLTVDYETLDDNSVTIRERDSMEQKRIKIDDLVNVLSEKI